jgi:hypothetical protein
VARFQMQQVAILFPALAACALHLPDIRLRQMHPAASPGGKAII